MRLPPQQHLFKGRVLCWFSRGAASACAAKLACAKYPEDELEILFCDTSEDEDPDNQRFQADVERWIGRSIKTIRSQQYRTCDEVFADTRYISGIDGARCTQELKRVPRIAYQYPEDVHIFGYTTDETMPGCGNPVFDRVAVFERNNPSLYLEWILCDAGLSKTDCFEMIRKAGIELPLAYRLGFEHANCRGCVKVTSPKYWNMTRRFYPDFFELRAKRSRALGVRLVRYKGERIFLDELPSDSMEVVPENTSCGPQCHMPDLTDLPS